MEDSLERGVEVAGVAEIGQPAVPWGGGLPSAVGMLLLLGALAVAVVAVVASMVRTHERSAVAALLKIMTPDEGPARWLESGGE